jgi:hypothetical protein
MTESELPQEVRDFLQQFVTSFEILELLVLTRRSAPRSWDLDALSEQTGIRPTIVEVALESLEASGLLQSVPAQPRRLYRYAPQDLTLAGIVDRVTETFDQQRALVLSVMSTQAIERVRSGAIRAFADSFVIKKN